MVFDSVNGLPYLASAILTSVGLMMLIHSYLKGNERIKYWIIPVFIHNFSLYIQFVDNGFLEDRFTFLHLSISGIGLICLIFISMNDYNTEFNFHKKSERKRVFRYVFYSIFFILTYILLMHLIFNKPEDLNTIIFYPLVTGILFSILLLFRIYKKKQTPTHMSIVIILILIETDLLLYILIYFTFSELLPFIRVIDTGIGIGMLFFAFNTSVENQLRLQNQLLVQTQEKLISQTQLSSIQIIAGGFAHDFNNILTSIIGNTSLIEDFPIFQEGDGKELIDDLKSASFQAKNMVNQLLVFSKGEEFLKKEIIDFTDLIKITTKFSLRGRKSKPIFDIDKDLWSVYGDSIQITQIVQNLVINADQSMSEGGIIEIKAHNIEFGPKNEFQLNPGKYIQFRIIDTGTGIPENIQEKIFSPFFTTKREGKGLGLSICKKIIEDHKGYMGFHTTVGKGTEFYFYTPAKEKKIKKIMKQKKLKIQFSGSALILDDNILVLRVIENLLINLGINTISSSESTTFLTTYADLVKNGEKIDLLIVDLTLPGDIGGKVIIEKIRHINPNAYVIVSSGYSDDFVMQNYKEYGFNDFLRKPYNKMEVIEVLKKVFGKK